MRNQWDKLVRRYGMPVGLLALVLVLQVFFRDVPLFSALNMKNVLLETVSIALTALGLSYIMISGEGDISFAGMFSLLTVVFAVLSNSLNRFSISFLTVTALAVGVYLLIAFLVTRLNFSSFIVSIAVMFMANGVEKALHQQTTLIQSQSILSFSTIGGGLPLVVWLMVIAYGVSYFIITRTRFGFSLRIVGENRDAAVEAGINGRRMKVAAYLIAGLLLRFDIKMSGVRSL